MDNDINTITICDPNDSTKCVTMMDRNLWANTNDITSTGSHWYHYQWWNNYWFASNYTNDSGSFPWGETAVQTQYDASSYWPSKWYNSWIFIYKNNSSFYDWSSKRNGNLRWWLSDTESNNWWYDLTKNVATNATNRQWPCPDWYHVPSAWEWNMLLSYFAQEKILKYNIRSGLYYYNLAWLWTEFQEIFKIPFAGFRMWSTSKISSVGSYDDLRTSTPVSSSSTNSFAFQLNSSATNAHNNFYRTYGFSIRCFRNTPLTFSVDVPSTGIIQAVLPENTFTDLWWIINESWSNIITWTYDYAAPTWTIDVKYNWNDELATGETVVLTLSAEDIWCNGTVSGMQFSCNWIFWTPSETYTTGKDFALWSYTSYGCSTINGEKTIYVRYIDGLGNISEIYSDSIMLNVSPKVELNSSSSGLCVGWTTYVTWIFNKAVKWLEATDIIVTWWCIKHFRHIWNNRAEWVLSNECHTYLKTVDGVNTISICNPNDSTKCVTMMDKNLWATTNNTASTWSYWKHYQWWNNYGFVSNFSNGSSTFPWWGSAYNGNKNASGYGPGNRYSDTNFVINKNDWSGCTCRESHR